MEFHITRFRANFRIVYVSESVKNPTAGAVGFLTSLNFDYH